MSRAKDNPIQPDWLSKTLAGLTGGFFIAMAGCGLFLQITPTIEGSIQAQLAMWLLMPLWMTVLCSCYFFHSGLRAWGWLLAINLVLWLLLFALRAL